MSYQRVPEVITTAVAALIPAVAPIPVSIVPLPVERYVRIDGYTVTGLEEYRNEDKARHNFFVHVFDSPDQGTHSSAWATQTLLQADEALRQVLVPRSTKFRLEQMTMTFDPRADGKYDAHAFARYTITTGEN